MVLKPGQDGSAAWQRSTACDPLQDCSNTSESIDWRSCCLAVGILIEFELGPKESIKYSGVKITNNYFNIQWCESYLHCWKSTFSQIRSTNLTRKYCNFTVSYFYFTNYALKYDPAILRVRTQTKQNKKDDRFCIAHLYNVIITSFQFTSWYL